MDTSFVVSSDESMDSVEERVNVRGVHQWQLEVEYFADRILNYRQLKLAGSSELV